MPLNKKPQPSGKNQVFLCLFTFSYFYFFMNSRSCQQIGIKWSVCISKSQRIYCIPFSLTDSGLCIYFFLFLCSNLLYNCLWITFPTQSYLLLYFFRVILLLSKCSHQFQQVVFHRKLSVSKYLQLSSTLLSTLEDLSRYSLNTFSDLHLSQAIFQVLWDFSDSSNYDW